MADRTALVVGARGVVGTNLIEHLAAEGGWDVIGLSRRGGADGPGVRHIAADLLDAAATRGIERRNSPGSRTCSTPPTRTGRRWSELVAPNVAMLGAVLDAVEPRHRCCSHVSLMQGYKVYGAHLGPVQDPGPGERPAAHAARVQCRAAGDCLKTGSATATGRGRRSAPRWYAAPHSAIR